jgi:ECF sigma factor
MPRVARVFAPGGCGVLGASPRVIALDDALNSLAEIDARKSQLVDLRFFGGLSIEETSAIIGVSPETVMHDWTMAKAWLRREMSTEHPTDIMKPELWQRIDDLFREALERDAGERDAFLAKAWAGDESLCREVQSLLASHERDGASWTVPHRIWRPACCKGIKPRHSWHKLLAISRSPGCCVRREGGVCVFHRPESSVYSFHGIATKPALAYLVESASFDTGSGRWLGPVSLGEVAHF